MSLIVRCSWCGTHLLRERQPHGPVYCSTKCRNLARAQHEHGKGAVPHVEASDD